MAVLTGLNLELLTNTVRAPKLVFNYLFRGLEGDNNCLRKAEGYFEMRDNLAISPSRDYSLCREFLEINSKLYGNDYCLFTGITDQELDLVFDRLRIESLERLALYQNN